MMLTASVTTSAEVITADQVGLGSGDPGRRSPRTGPVKVATDPVGWADERGQLRQEWNTHLEALQSWLSAPDELGDDYIDAPSQETIETALALAESMIRRSYPPPTRVGPTAEGGIAFEHRVDDALERIEIDPDGDAEYTLFRNSQLIERAELTELGMTS